MKEKITTLINCIGFGLILFYILCWLKAETKLAEKETQYLIVKNHIELHNLKKVHCGLFDDVDIDVEELEICRNKN